MKLVVIESPYAGNIERNVAYAKQCMRHSLSLGEAPIASHLLYTQEGILNDAVLSERELGIAAGHEWMRKADLVAIYADWGISSGMEKAIQLAASLEKPIEVRILIHKYPMILHATYRHKKTQRLYTVISYTRLQINNPTYDNSWGVFYENDKKELFVRPITEFYDGRFEKVSSNPGFQSPQPTPPTQHKPWKPV